MDDLRQDTDYDLLRRLRKLVQISSNDSFPLQESVYDYLLQIASEIIRRQTITYYKLSTRRVDEADKEDLPF